MSQATETILHAVALCFNVVLQADAQAYFARQRNFKVSALRVFNEVTFNAPRPVLKKKLKDEGSSPRHLEVGGGAG
jgi:hypothetical protein